MALADANDQCKAAILSLSIEPDPTLHDMLQVCARKVPFIKAHQNHNSRVKPPQKAAAADTMPPVPVPRPLPKSRTMCPLCWTLGISMPFKEAISGLWGQWGWEVSKVQREFFKKIENVNVKLNNPALTSSAFQQKSPDVIVKDPATWKIRETKSPHDQVTWGHGYAYVSTPPDLKWVPAEWVKPFIPKTAKPPAEASQVASAAWRRRKH
ncbi:hypothetical protein DUI87_16510 [Hirundo rustica rustica]|uniref:Integrase-type domain-containing protein n=1 Tax=Hirundo rustica rustica TaxID=333673 RepID=A0A3M0K1Q7_HIRRU|nr:hypothetical protein DUI87_16510 [Hirundo rustica rustica]